jgi:hypothetical protein
LAVGFLALHRQVIRVRAQAQVLQLLPLGQLYVWQVQRQQQQHQPLVLLPVRML